MKNVMCVLSLLFVTGLAFAQDGRALLIVDWPAPYKWKSYDAKTGADAMGRPAGLNYGLDDVKFFPEDQSDQDWTLMGEISHSDCRPGLNNPDSALNEAMNKIEAAEKNKSGTASTVIERQLWAPGRQAALIFKIEHVNAGGLTYSALYYLCFGGYAQVWTVMIRKKAPFLGATFVSEWTRVFKANHSAVW